MKSTFQQIRNPISPLSPRGVLVLTAVFGLALSPMTEAVSPPPDGGYANGNTAEGTNALFSLTTGFHNTANGFEALLRTTTGNHNTANGDSALESNATGDDNTADGAHSLTSNTTGSGNTVLGFNAGNSITTANNVIVIGENVAGANVSNSTFIGNIFGATATGGVAVFIDSSGKLGTGTSSRRFKDDIEPMDKASDALYSLKPVTFRYKKQIDPKGISQFGLVAEDVEKVNPDLVVRDKEGRSYTVRYDAVNAMVLNEFLKEHKKVEGQQATIAELTSTLVQQQKDFQAASALQERKIQALAARVKEQGAQIQKVSAELQLNKPAPQTVLNNQ